MSESGGFGDGFDSGGGGDSGSSFFDNSGGGGGSGGGDIFSGVFSGGGSSAAPAWSGTGGAGPTESGAFGSTTSSWNTWGSDSGWGRQGQGYNSGTSSVLPYLEGGLAGFLLGRGTAPQQQTVAYQQWSPGYQYAPQYGPVPQASPPPYAPIVAPTAVPYGSASASPLTAVHYQYGADERWARTRRFLKGAFVAACVTAFCLYFFAFASHSVELREREQHLLTATSWFATGITVASKRDSSYWPGPSHPVSFMTSAVTFASRPPLSKKDRFQLGQAGVVVPRLGYQAWPVWLNRGSTVQVTYSASFSRDPLVLVVVRGRSEMETWKENPRDADDESHGVVMERALSGRGSLSFTAKQDGLHFFALANFERSAVSCDLYLDVTSREYDLRGSVASCDLTYDTAEPCQVDLPLLGARYVVLASSAGNDPARLSRRIRVSYQPRLLAYLVLILAPWVLAALLDAARKRKDASERAAASSAAAEVGAPPAPGHQFAAPRTAAVAESRWLKAGDAAAGGSAVGSGASQDAGPHRAPIPDSWVSSGEATAPGAGAAPGAQVLRGEASSAAPSAPRLEEDLEGGGGYSKAQGAGGGGAGSGTSSTENVCAVCMEMPKDCVILDCGHRATCFSCGKLLQASRNPQCPICRRPIKQVTKVYDV